MCFCRVAGVSRSRPSHYLPYRKCCGRRFPCIPSPRDGEGSNTMKTVVRMRKLAACEERLMRVMPALPLLLR